MTRISVDVHLLVNRPFYLSIKLSGNFEWKNMESKPQPERTPNIQAVKGERQGVENRLNFLVRRGKGGFLTQFVCEVGEATKCLESGK